MKSFFSLSPNQRLAFDSKLSWYVFKTFSFLWLLIYVIQFVSLIWLHLQEAASNPLKSSRSWRGDNPYVCGCPCQCVDADFG